MDVFVFFLMLNYLTDDAEHCTFEGYQKSPHFLFKGHNSAKNYSIVKKSFKGYNSDKISEL